MAVLAPLRICKIAFTPDPAGGWIQARFDRSGGGGNNYMYVDMTSVADYVVQAGDVIEFDVFLPTGSQLSGVGNFDLAFSDATKLQDPANGGSVVDQNGIALHNGNITAWASGAWYHRRVTMPYQTWGKTITKYDLVDEADTAITVTHYAYYRDIQITDGSGQLRKLIWFQATVLPIFAIDVQTPAFGTFTGSKSQDPPVWTDVSDRLREPYNIRRGRQTELDVIEAGTHTVALDNRDGKLTPMNTISPYYPNVVPERRILEQTLYPPNLNTSDADFEASTGGWNPIGAGVTLAWVSTRAWQGTKSLEIQIPKTTTNGGAQSPLLPLYKLPGMMGYLASIYAWVVGGGIQMSWQIDWYQGASYLSSSPVVTGTPDGVAWLRFSSGVVVPPAAADGFQLYIYRAPIAGGTTVLGLDAVQMEPMSKYASGPSPFMNSGTLYGRFSGFIERWPPVSSFADATVTIVCSDGFEPFNNQKLNTTYLSEVTDVRFNNLLDAVGWPTADRTYETGKTTIQGITLTDAPVLSHMQDLMRTESGLVFIGADGKAIFQNRHHRILYNGVSLASFGELSETGELPYESAAPSYDKDKIYNDVAVTRQGGSEQHVVDRPSQNRYWPRTFGPVTTFVTTDAEALTYAQWLLRRFKQPSLRFDSIKLVAPYSDDPINIALIKQILAREIGDRITVTRRPPPIGTYLISVDCHIEAIQQDDYQDRLECTWTLSPADNTAFWVLDSTTNSVLDYSTALAY